ncbi:formate dehydrogenase accessory protein FdhE [Bacillaceae bacterium S4-13-58]
MKNEIVSEEYIELQKKLLDVQKRIEEQIDQEHLTVLVEEPFKIPHLPLYTQVAFNVDRNIYLEAFKGILGVMLESQPSLQNDASIFGKIMDANLANQWIEEALSMNEYYFVSWAEENKVQSWLPYFMAEQALRPFMRVLAKLYETQIKDVAKTAKHCPCCGEPVRLAQLEQKGKKFLVCPRCYAKWQEKRLSCSHCGNDDHQKLKYLSVERQKEAQIQVCNECNGYIKVIDTSAYIQKPEPALLDILTIHLDYIAQEKGYGDIKQDTQKQN